MKKLLALATMFLYMTVFGYADSASTIQKTVDQLAQSEALSGIPDSAKLTFSKVYSDVKTGIAALASSLKVGAEHVYEVLVRQQLVISITWLIFLILAFLAWIPYFKCMPNDDFARMFYIVFLGGGLLAFTGISVCHIEMILTGIINPEYGAIKDIISIINPSNPK